MASILDAAHRRLIRRCLSEASMLPDAVTRLSLTAHYRSTIIKRVRRPHGFTPERVSARVRKTVHTLEHLHLRMLASRSGQLEAMTQVLSDAYGRSGHLHDQLLAPFLVPPPPPTDPPLPYPSSHFPRFSPALQALLTSPASHTSSRLPTSAASLRAFPTTITRIWADLPDAAPQHEGNVPYMGVVSPARQVNMRRAQFKKWTRQLRAPLGDVVVRGGQRAGAELRRSVGLNVHEDLVEWGNDALDLLRSCARPIPSPRPRFSPLDAPPRTTTPAFRVPTSPDPLLPRLIPPTHPLHPTPLPLSDRQLDPLVTLLPPKHQPTLPDPLTLQLGKSRGPRPVTARLLQRRYRAILSTIPVLEYVPATATPPEVTQKSGAKRNRSDAWVEQEEQRVGIDRSWMTPTLSGGGQLRVISALDLEEPTNVIRGEDLLWL